MSGAKPRRGPVSKVARRRAERLLADSLPQMVVRAVELALLGDPVCLKACLDRAMPVTPAADAQRGAGQ